MIPEIDPYNNYRGDGVATQFDYDFFIQNGSQLIVEKIDSNDIVTRLEQDIDYEIVEIDGEYAGYIKFPIEDSLHGVLQDNEILSLQLDLPFHQDSEYGQSSLLDLNSLEFSLDYLTRLCQILKRQLERSVKVNEGSEATPNELLDTINNNAKLAVNSANIATEKANEANESASIAEQKTQEVVQKGEEIIVEGQNQISTIQQVSQLEQEEIQEIINRIDDGKAVYIGEDEPTDPVYSVWVDTNDDEVAIDIEEIKEKLEKVGSGLEIGDIGTAIYVDETKGKRRHLNGQIIIQEDYESFTTWLKNFININSDYACTETEWQTQATMNIDGCVYKYVIDDEAGTIRLPKYPEYVEIDKLATSGSISGLQIYGNGKTIGWTNGEVTGGGGIVSNNGITVCSSALNETLPSSAGGILSGIGPGDAIGLTTNASKSGITGKGSATLNQQQTKLKLKYFIQVATGQETKANIINKLELANPYTLLEYKYSENELYNSCWLRSKGQWNDSITYATVYEALQVEKNTEVEIGITVELPSGINYTKRGLSVKISTQGYTDYDFVLNETNNTFRLPIKNKTAPLDATKKAEVDVDIYGNGMAIGLSNGTQTAGLQAGSGASGFLSGKITSYGKSVSTAYGTGDAWNTAIGLTTDASKSGIVGSGTADLSSATADLYLYYYVGEIEQNANLVNVGRIEETIVDIKAELSHKLNYNDNNLPQVYGQWRNKTLELTTATAVGTYTIDLTNYLPKDSYNYEIMVTSFVYSTGNSESRLSFKSDLITNDMCFTMTNTNSRHAGNTIIVPISSSRKIYFKIQTSAINKYIVSPRAIAYRRMGTNI